MTSRRISGNRTAEDIVREHYERLKSEIRSPQEPDSVSTPSIDPIQPQTLGGFYQIDKTKIIPATTQEYRTFLKEAGYMDLDAGNGLLVAKSVLKIDQNVRTVARTNGFPLNGNDGDYVTNINHSNARKLTACFEGKLLTTGLMYKVFIPFIKDLAGQGNAEAQATLDEMVNTKAEWLEDLILNKNKVKIGNKNKQLTLLQTDGRFDRADMHELGYPANVKQNGEFYYWFPRDNERAAIRDGDSDLGLGLDWGPSVGSGWLGVRVAKNLP